ncbi:MAG: hypothetical protein IT303_20405 [Dehalococcoidia bacterium]|nr:hypothetical protein [Dehalococcoidia bacterium]
MAFPVEMTNVTGVLLADGWHVVDWAVEGGELVSTFAFARFAFTSGGEAVQDGRSVVAGFSFCENRELIAGPLSSLLAVRSATAEQAEVRRARSRESAAVS